MSFSDFCAIIGQSADNPLLIVLFFEVAGGNPETAYDLYTRDPDAYTDPINSQQIHHISQSQLPSTQSTDGTRYGTKRKANQLDNARYDTIDEGDTTNSSSRNLDRSVSLDLDRQRPSTRRQRTSNQNQAQPSSQPYLSYSNDGRNFVRLRQSTSTTDELNPPQFSHQATINFASTQDTNSQSEGLLSKLISGVQSLTSTIFTQDIASQSQPPNTSAFRSNTTHLNQTHSQLTHSQQQQSLQNHQSISNLFTTAAPPIHSQQQSDENLARALQSEADEDLSRQLFTSLNATHSSQTRAQTRTRRGQGAISSEVPAALQNALGDRRANRSTSSHNQSNANSQNSNANHLDLFDPPRTQYSHVDFSKTPCAALPTATLHPLHKVLLLDQWCGGPEYFASSFPTLRPSTTFSIRNPNYLKGSSKPASSSSSPSTTHQPLSYNIQLSSAIFSTAKNCLDFFRTALEANNWAFVWITPPDHSTFQFLSKALYDSTFTRHAVFEQLTRSNHAQSPYTNLTNSPFQQHQSNANRAFGATVSNVEVQAAHFFGDIDLYQTLDRWFTLKVSPLSLDVSSLKPWFFIVDPTTFAPLCTFTYETVVFSWAYRSFIPLFLYFVAASQKVLFPPGSQQTSSKLQRPLVEINHTTISVDADVEPASVILAMLKLANFLQRNDGHREEMLANRYSVMESAKFAQSHQSARPSHSLSQSSSLTRQRQESTNSTPQNNTIQHELDKDASEVDRRRVIYRSEADQLAMTGHPSNACKYAGTAFYGPVMRDKNEFFNAFRWYIFSSKRVKTTPSGGPREYFQLQIPLTFLLHHNFLNEYYTVADEGMVIALESEQSLLTLIESHRCSIYGDGNGQYENSDIFKHHIHSPQVLNNTDSNNAGVASDALVRDGDHNPATMMSDDASGAITSTNTPTTTTNIPTTSTMASTTPLSSTGNSTVVNQTDQNNNSSTPSPPRRVFINPRFAKQKSSNAMDDN